MATRFPPRARILVCGGLAGALAGLFVGWLCQRVAVSEAASMADCERRELFCLAVGSRLVPLFASPVAGLTAGVVFAAAGVRPAPNVFASAVAVAVLTVVTGGAIEFATPPATGTVLPPTGPGPGGAVVTGSGDAGQASPHLPFVRQP
ncbi:MAG TPA: hypothetical protein VGR98_09120 [Streptosporangiaceae bacterium]|nr:hypothetical protein [Streptosporangiaceae bacterium]